MKNLIELKNAQRVVIDGNIIEYNWAAAQTGYAIVFTPRNQDGRAPWSVVQQVEVTNNVIRHVASVFNILGTDNIHPSRPTNDILIRNNLVLDMSRANWGGSGQFVLTLGGSNITVDHNTVFTDGTSALYADVAAVSGFVFTNNIVPDNSWAVMGADASPGNGTIAMYYPGSTFRGNIFIGSNPNTYPAGNFYPAVLGAVGFVDPSANFRLAPTSAYRSSATDGTDVGANIPAINSAAGTQVPNFSPRPAVFIRYAVEADPAEPCEDAALFGRRGSDARRRHRRQHGDFQRRRGRAVEAAPLPTI